VRVAVSLLAIWLLMQVSQILLLVVIALILTLALVPPTRYLERRGMQRVVASGIVFLGLVAMIAGFFANRSNALSPAIPA
jgi:predicted PurR-regulated permease PerM